MKLNILKMRKQIVDGIRNLLFVRIFKAHCLLIKYSATLATIFIAQNSFAIPMPSSSWQLASDQAEVRGFRLFAEWVHLDKLPFENRAYSLDNIDELLSPSQEQAISIVQVRTSNGAENKGEERKQPGIRPDKNINFIEHYPGLSLIAFNFLLGVSAPLILGFALHARKHGINNAWRDLVFTWPIPYWMRFVPKDERGLP